MSNTQAPADNRVARYLKDVLKVKENWKLIMQPVRSRSNYTLLRLFSSG